MPLSEATLHGAAEIAVPTLVSTLAISCVFTSVVFLEGPAKYLFTPLGLAVVFAMLASYGLSRTLTPITIGLLLKGERNHGESGRPSNIFTRASAAFERGFERLRDGYSDLLLKLLRHRAVVPVVAVLVLALALTATPGQGALPAAKAGSDWVSYESYLFELRHLKHYYETQQEVDFKSDSGKSQLTEFKKPIRACTVDVGASDTQSSLLARRFR